MITKDKTEDLLKILEPEINKVLFLAANLIKTNAKKKFKPAVLAGVTKKGKKKYANPQPKDSIHDRTGFLRISISQSDVKNFMVTVGTPVKYGAYNELGTLHVPPRPFLKPAAFESGPAIKEIAKTHLGNKIKVVIA